MKHINDLRFFVTQTLLGGLLLFMAPAFVAVGTRSIAATWVTIVFGASVGAVRSFYRARHALTPTHLIAIPYVIIGMGIYVQGLLLRNLEMRYGILWFGVLGSTYLGCLLAAKYGKHISDN
jgi:multisubunit Na+/H+ antiporter MnhG subunit